MSLDDRLRSVGRHPVDADVDGALAAIIARDRARQVRRFAAAGVIGLVVLVGGVLLASNRDERAPDRGVVAGPPPNGPPPDAVGAGPIDFVVHADEMTKGDRWLAAFVVNTGSDTVNDRYLDLVIERWDGTAWITTGERTVRSCDGVLCVSAPTVEGGLGLLKTEVELAPGDELGPLWIDLADQEVGEYRLVAGVGGTTQTTARIDIVDVAAGLLSLDQRRDRLVFDDALIEPGVEAEASVTVLGAGDRSMADLDALATLERWTGSEFAVVDASPQSAITLTSDPELVGYVLPPLDPGAYRLATALDGEPINGWVFVREPDDDGTTDSESGPLSRSPLPPRENPAVARLGDDLLVWGGIVDSQIKQDDGAVYDLVSDRWQVLPEAPLASSFDPVATATNDGFVVFSDGKAAVYDPALQEWQAMPDTGAEVTEAFFVSDTLLADSGRGLLSYRGGQWDVVEPAPVNDTPTIVATDRDLIVLRAVGDEIRGDAYDPIEDSWRAIAAPPSTGNVLGDATWTGQAVVWAGYEVTFPVTSADSTVLLASSYAPDTDSWSTLPPLPVRFSEGIPAVGVSDGLLYVLRYPALLTLVDGFWLPVPARGDIWPAELVDSSVGAIGFRDDRFVRLDPTTEVRGPLTLQVGGLAVALESGDRLIGSAPLKGSGSDSGMTLEVETTSGPCTLLHEYEPDGVTPAHPPLERSPGVVEVRLEDGGPPLQITCADTATAMRLAETALQSP